MPATPQDGSFPHLDDLRRAYDRDAVRRNGFTDLQWRPGVLEEWLKGLPQAPRLLELGPGTGQLALHAQQLGANVHAIDLSSANVVYCRQRGIAAEVGDLRTVGDMSWLGHFDGVYSINVLLHVPRAGHAAVIAGMRERLVPGGSLLIVLWGGRDEEGIFEGDSCDPPRFFSSYDDAAFLALRFEGFEVVRQEVLAIEGPEGFRPQLLVLRNPSAPRG